MIYGADESVLCSVQTEMTFVAAERITKVIQKEKLTTNANAILFVLAKWFLDAFISVKTYTHFFLITFQPNITTRSATMTKKMKKKKGN